MQSPFKKALFAISAGIFSIVVLRLVVLSSGMAQQIDQALFAAVISLRTDTATDVMRAVTMMGREGVILVGLLLLGWFLLRSKYSLANRLAALFVGSYLLQDATKLLFSSARPPTSYWLVLEDSASFPSGHTLGATVLFGFLYWLVRRSPVAVWQRRTALVLTVISVGAVGLSRVYLGVHWPSDVVAGLILGIFWLRAVLR